jgi:hypothetical protein
VILESSCSLQVDGQWETEIIRDQAVIRAYIKSKEMAEEEMTEADSLAPTGDVDKDARARKRYTARFPPSPNRLTFTTGWKNKSRG